MRRGLLVLLALAGCGDATVPVLTSTGPCGADPGAPGEAPLRAGAFVGGITIEAFLHYGGTAYDDPALVARHLRALGVQRIHSPGFNTTVDRRLPALARDAGVTISLAIDPMFNLMFSADDCAGRPAACRDALSVARELGPALDTFVVVGTADDRASAAWAGQVSARASALRAALAADPTTAHVRLVGPAVDTAAQAELMRPVAGAVDLPSFGWSFSPGPPGDIFDRALADVGAAGAPPRVTQGMFWRTGTSPGSDITERVDAKYVLRGMLEAATRRLVRTYFHELLDVRADWVAGLVRYDGQPKIAYGALARLLHLLADPGPEFVTAPLDYRLTASNRVHHLLLQQRSGATYLVLWRELKSADADTSEPVEIALSTRVSSAAAFLPLDGDAAVMETPWPTRLTVQVPDHPLVLKLAPVCP